MAMAAEVMVNNDDNNKGKSIEILCSNSWASSFQNISESGKNFNFSSQNVCFIRKCLTFLLVID